jgi:hypothetical protein
MRHLSSPRIPWAPITWATTRYSTSAAGLDDVEVDAGAFAGCSGFDEGA